MFFARMNPLTNPRSVNPKTSATIIPAAPGRSNRPALLLFLRREFLRPDGATRGVARMDSLLDARLERHASRRHARLQAVARRVGRVVALHLQAVLYVVLVARQRGQGFDELFAVGSDGPDARLKQLVHEHPSTHTVIICVSGPGQACRSENVPELLGDRGFSGPMRESVRRKIYVRNLFST